MGTKDESLRFILSINNHLIDSNVTHRLRDGITKQLRRVWLETGLDYSGVEIRGIQSNIGTIASMNEFWADVAAVDGQSVDAVKQNTRLIISDQNLKVDSAAPDGSVGRLLVTADAAGGTSWGPGGANTHADVHFSDPHPAPHVEATVSDIFQDIMTANSSLVSSLVSRYLDTGQTLDDFFALKANYAASRAGQSQRTAVFPSYNPVRYGSFATLARNSMQHGPLGFDAKLYASIWEHFLLTKLSHLIPTADEVIPYLLSGRFRRPNSSEPDGEGRTKGKRIAFPTIPRTSLESLLNDRQVVTRTGAYVIFISSKVPSSNVDDLGALMGWKNEKAKKIKRIKLAPISSYADYIEHVHTGYLTPVRLFLKVEHDVD